MDAETRSHEITRIQAERPRCKALEERCAKLEEVWDRILSAYMRCDGESKLVMQAVGDARAALAERGAAVVPSRSLLRYQLERALKKVEMLADRSHAQETQLAEAQAFLTVERGEREDLAELLEQLTLAVGAPNFAEAVRLAIAGTGGGK